MDFLIKDDTSAEKIHSEKDENRLPLLSELQLALVGGGCGEVIVQ